MKRMIARIFEDVGGYYICDEADGCLDARGTPRKTKAQALRDAADMGYTHAIGSGCPWNGVQRIPSRYQ